MRAVYAVCCETVLQDLRSNNISLINLLDEVLAVAFPVLIQKITFVALLERAENEPSIAHCRLVGKLNGNIAFNFEISVDFQGRFRSRAVGEFQGIFIQAPGNLTMSFYHQEHELTTVTLNVRNIGNPQAELFAGPGPLQPQ
jgi:hypothetical protein